MKLGIPNSVVMAAIAVLGTVLLTGTPGMAQSPAFSNFSSTTGLTLNGNAAQNGNVLRLTPAAGSQDGSVWFNTKQPVVNGFSTTFTFQITSGAQPNFPADGIAFVIQNSAAGLSAIGGAGGGMGYDGLPNSLAIEFDTYQNSYDPDNNHVAIQSCGANPNSADHTTSCHVATAPSTGLHGVILSDGAVHSVTITYGSGKLDVLLDNNDLFPGGVAFDITTLGLDNGTAWVGFTSATGANVENGDLLSWTFTPQSGSGVAMQTTPAVVPFQNDAYNYSAQLNSGSPTTFTVNPILLDPTVCDNMLLPNFPGAHCFVYQNALGSGMDKAVMFELTWPTLPSSPSCSPFDAELGTSFNLSANNPGFNPSNPFPGWLKGEGPNTASPCQPDPNPNNPLFVSNQIDFFALTRTDPFTKGGSGGTGSCWVATYDTPFEAPGVNIVAPVNGGTYQLGESDASTKANYSCTTVNKGAASATGPYLTPSSCNGTDSPGGAVTSGAQFDTSTAGPHTFTVTVVDSATDNTSQSVTYNVVGPADLAILNLAPLAAATGSKLTYTIGVADFGPSIATGVVVTDILPAGVSFMSASGNTESCTLSKKGLSCTVTPITCSGGSTVTCTVGTLSPLSLSSLNGATMQITVKVTAAARTTIKNKATVSGNNADPKPGNNSSTASTAVTAH